MSVFALEALIADGNGKIDAKVLSIEFSVVYYSVFWHFLLQEITKIVPYPALTYKSLALLFAHASPGYLS